MQQLIKHTMYIRYKYTIANASWQNMILLHELRYNNGLPWQAACVARTIRIEHTPRAVDPMSTWPAIHTQHESNSAPHTNNTTLSQDLLLYHLYHITTRYNGCMLTILTQCILLRIIDVI